MHAGPEIYRIGSWSGSIKVDLNEALVSLGLVLLMFVVFSDCCLGFTVVSLL